MVRRPKKRQVNPLVLNVPQTSILPCQQNVPSPNASNEALTPLTYVPDSSPASPVPTSGHPSHSSSVNTFKEYIESFLSVKQTDKKNSELIIISDDDRDEKKEQKKEAIDKVSKSSAMSKTESEEMESLSKKNEIHTEWVGNDDANQTIDEKKNDGIDAVGEVTTSLDDLEVPRSHELEIEMEEMEEKVDPTDEKKLQTMDTMEGIENEAQIDDQLNVLNDMEIEENEEEEVVVEEEVEAQGIIEEETDTSTPIGLNTPRIRLEDVENIENNTDSEGSDSNEATPTARATPASSEKMVPLLLQNNNDTPLAPHSSPHVQLESNLDVDILLDPSESALESKYIHSRTADTTTTSATFTSTTTSTTTTTTSSSSSSPSLSSAACSSSLSSSLSPAPSTHTSSSSVHTKSSNFQEWLIYLSLESKMEVKDLLDLHFRCCCSRKLTEIVALSSDPLLSARVWSDEEDQWLLSGQEDLIEKLKEKKTDKQMHIRQLFLKYIEENELTEVSKFKELPIHDSNNTTS